MSAIPGLEVLGGPALRGSLTLTLECSADWTDGAVADVNTALKAFVAAGARGGYRATPPGGSRSTLVIDRPPAARGTLLEAELTAENVEVRALQFFRHMVARFDFGDAVITRIVVRERQAMQRKVPPNRYPPVDEQNEEDMYPDPLSPQPFQVIWAETSDSKSRRVEVELGKILVAADLDKVSEAAALWGALLEGGAFALPLGPPDEIESVFGSASQFDEYSVEIEVAVYRASEAGWDVLVNVLATTAAEGLPITGVTIE